MINIEARIISAKSVAGKRVKYDDQGDYGYLVTEPVVDIQEPVAELVLFDNVNLTVGVETGTIYRLDGLTNKTAWKNDNVTQLDSISAYVKINTSDFNKDSGIAYDTSLVNMHKHYDEVGRTLQVGMVMSGQQNVRIFENVILFIKSNEVCGLIVEGI